MLLSIKSGLQTNTVCWKLCKNCKKSLQKLWFWKSYMCSWGRTEKLIFPRSHLSSAELWTSPGVIFLHSFMPLFTLHSWAVFRWCLVFRCSSKQSPDSCTVGTAALCSGQAQISWCTSIKLAPAEPWKGFCVLMKLWQHCKCSRDQSLSGTWAKLTDWFPS